MAREIHRPQKLKYNLIEQTERTKKIETIILQLIFTFEEQK